MKTIDISKLIEQNKKNIGTSDYYTLSMYCDSKDENGIYHYINHSIPIHNIVKIKKYRNGYYMYDERINYIFRYHVTDTVKKFLDLE